MQDKVAILEAELADYRRKKESEEEGEEEERRKSEDAVDRAEFNDVKMRFDETKMELQTVDLERKELQVWVEA